MVDYLLDLYEPVVDHVVFVVQSGVERAVLDRARGRALDAACEVQALPTGMLDAILVPHVRVRAARPDWIWITWCDQVAILPETVQAMVTALERKPSAAIVLPTCRQPAPYIHFERDGTGRIVRIRQRREGDAMPEVGESDAGLFALSQTAYVELLPEYAAGEARGGSTGERNFLPFIAWLSSQDPAAVCTFPCKEVIESVGINTPDDLRRVEEHLAARAAARRAPEAP